MALILPIEELLEAGSPKGSAGRLDPVNEAQADALFDEVKKGDAADLGLLRQVAEGLFRGGEIPDLTAERGSGAKVTVKPLKHLKAALTLAMTGLESDGLAGFADGLVLIERLLGTQWETVHPVANSEDADDPYIGRVNVLMPLCFEDPAKSFARPGSVSATDSWRLEQRLLKATFFSSERHGALSFRDSLSPFAKSLKFTLPPGEEKTVEQVRDCQLGSAELLPRQREALTSAIAALEGMGRVFKEAPGNIKPRFDYLLRLLNTGLTLLDKVVAPGERIMEKPGQDKPVTLPAGVTPAGPLTSKDAAIRKLDEAAEYFRRCEPSSPVPILIDRVKRMAYMNFVSLLGELELGEKEFRKWAGLPERSAVADASGKAQPAKT